MLNIFYNKNNLKDCMVISVENKPVTKIENHDNYCLLFNEARLIGLNIFNFSNYLNLKPGFIYPTFEIIETIKNITSIDLNSFVDKNFVVGEIKQIKKVENTHLNYCDVSIGENKILKIICGAKNVQTNKKVVVAMLNTSMPNGMMIIKSKIQGLESCGMLCSEKELNIEWKQKFDGIILLDDSYVVGDLFKYVFSNLV